MSKPTFYFLCIQWVFNIELDTQLKNSCIQPHRVQRPSLTHTFKKQKRNDYVMFNNILRLCQETRFFLPQIISELYFLTYSSESSIILHSVSMLLHHDWLNFFSLLYLLIRCLLCLFVYFTPRSFNEVISFFEALSLFSRLPQAVKKYVIKIKPHRWLMLMS